MAVVPYPSMYDILNLSPQILYNRRLWRASVHAKELKSLNLQGALEELAKAGVRKLKEENHGRE